MRSLVDAQLPIALARWLVSNGFEADHVSDLGLQTASDTEIWNSAIANAAIVVTKDEDFAQRRIFSQLGPAVVWVRRGNTRNRDLLVWFEALMPQLANALERGETLVELV